MEMPRAKASDLVIGVASTMSRALPAGGPSRMSVRMTSASSMSTMRCAVVDPTKPEPTTVTFFLLIRVFSVHRISLAAKAPDPKEGCLSRGPQTVGRLRSISPRRPCLSCFR